MFRLRAVGLVLAVAAALTAPALAAAPTNDAFASAAELSGRVTTVSALNKDATKEPGEPNHAGEAGGASIWYRWTAPAGGKVTVSTCDSAFDTVLAAYTGDSLATLVELAANDDACGLQSQLTFAAVEGTTYRIAVDGVDALTGEVSLSLRLAPPNDDFVDAQVLVGDEGSVAGTNAGSTRQAGEPGYLSVSVWYRWTAPSTGFATFETCGTSFDTILAAFTGDAVDALTQVHASDDACGLASRVNFVATAGVTYSIAVDGYGTGDFQLSWNRNPPPPEPPYAQDYPVISGIAREGETLTAIEGPWAGTQPLTFTYSWGRCDADYSRCVFVDGAQSRTYLLTAADIGYHVYVRVTATNAAGSGYEYSDPTALVTSSGPLNTARPTVSGRAIVGEALSASQGSWSGPTPMQFTYQWQACDTSVSACVNLVGETLGFIELKAAHVGKRLRVVVTATNVDGSRSAVSDAAQAVGARKATRALRCVVPSVRGKSLKQAKTRIRRAHCKTGRVVRKYSASIRRGRVISQAPKAGARLKQNARINLVISKGKRK